MVWVSNRIESNRVKDRCEGGVGWKDLDGWIDGKTVYVHWFSRFLMLWGKGTIGR